MNQRIRELAEQCATPERFDVAKFAELMVKECAYIAMINTPDTEECEYTHLVSEAIKEHFGVEE